MNAVRPGTLAARIDRGALDDRLRDRQPQPAARGVVVRPRAVDLVEALEHVRQVRAGDPFA